MTTEQTSHGEVFISKCERAFAFLVHDHGFIGPEIDSATPGLLFATYREGQVGVECMLEQRDDDASVSIIRLQEGHRPTDYRINDSGVIVRERLTQLLIQRGVRDISFTPPAKERGMTERQSRYRKALEGYARMLRNYAKDVLEGSVEILGGGR
jgi:hypothetical protein